MMNEIQTVSQLLVRRDNYQHDTSQKNFNTIRDGWLQSPIRLHQKSRANKKKRILHEYFKFYCNNSSINSCKYITDERRTWFERIVWIFLHVVMISILGTIIWDVLQDYKHKPVVTVVDSDHYPSNLLEFPGISVCSINRISKKAALKLAKQIVSLNITKLSVAETLQLIYNLGNLYESSFKKGYDGTELDNLLQNYFNGSYYVIKLMKELTPACEEMLLKCRFRASNKNCSQLFSFRLTQDGYCCLFNYIREHDQTDGEMKKNKKRDPEKIDKLTLLNSLTFLMEPDLDDYFFTLLPITGWKITIFNPNDYPDSTSGGVTETLIEPGTENFLELNAISFFSEKTVRNFDVYDRKCIFKDEVSILYNSYTYSDCIVDCKVKDVWKACGCQPFFYPVQNSHRVCNTSDIQCLHTYKSKWWSIMPHDMNQESKESQIFNVMNNESWSLHCKNCFPSCDDVRYFLQTSSVTLRNDEQNFFLQNVTIVNQSMVHIYFTKYGTLRLKQDRTYYWYELLSDIGGLCSIFIGFSLISAVEFMYFLVLLCINIYRNHYNLKSINKNVKTTVAHKVRPLYWTELVPGGKITNQKIKSENLILHYEFHD